MGTREGFVPRGTCLIALFVPYIRLVRHTSRKDTRITIYIIIVFDIRAQHHGDTLVRCETIAAVDKLYLTRVIQRRALISRVRLFVCDVFACARVRAVMKRSYAQYYNLYTTSPRVAIGIIRNVEDV